MKKTGFHFFSENDVETLMREEKEREMGYEKEREREAGKREEERE
jgi:hypothetical protein